PAYSDYKTHARRTACKGALGAMRAAIANFHATSHGERAATAFPTVGQLTACGAVLAGVLPANPLSARGPRDGLVESPGKKGDVTGAAGGWCYNPVTGEIWANTNTPEVGENAF